MQQFHVIEIGCIGFYFAADIKPTVGIRLFIKTTIMDRLYTSGPLLNPLQSKLSATMAELTLDLNCNALKCEVTYQITVNHNVMVMFLFGTTSDK